MLLLKDDEFMNFEESIIIIIESKIFDGSFGIKVVILVDDDVEEVDFLKY